MIEELRLAVRWGIGIQFLKTPGQWDCDYCESKKTLKKDRNCDWDQPGKCQKCGWKEINPITKKVPLQVEHVDGHSENT